MRLGVALVSGCLIHLSACSSRPSFQTPNPDPIWRCYALITDTAATIFVPERLVLGSNNVGSLGWRAAAIKPDRLPGLRSGEKLGASWLQRGADSIEAAWYVPGSMFGPISYLVGTLTGDSLYGRAFVGGDLVYINRPSVPVRGHAERCAAGA